MACIDALQSLAFCKAGAISMRLGEMQSMIASHICNIVAWKRVYLLAVSSPDVFELYLHLRYVDFISYIFVLHL